MFYLLFSQTKEEGIRGFWATHLVLKDIFHLGYLQEFDARELKLFSFFFFFTFWRASLSCPSTVQSLTYMRLIRFG